MMSNPSSAGPSSKTANGRASHVGLSSNARKRTSQKIAPSVPLDDSLTSVKEPILGDDDILKYLYCCNQFDAEDQPMLRGFTAADSTQQFPTTTKGLFKLVK